MVGHITSKLVLAPRAAHLQPFSLPIAIAAQGFPVCRDPLNRCQRMCSFAALAPTSLLVEARKASRAYRHLSCLQFSAATSPVSSYSGSTGRAGSARRSASTFAAAQVTTGAVERTQPAKAQEARRRKERHRV